jgi:membrane protease YdiL (CAAX protease family)
MTVRQSRGSLLSKLRAPERAAPWGLSQAALYVGAYLIFSILMIFSVSTLTGEITGVLPSPRTIALAGLFSSLIVAMGIFRFASVRYKQTWAATLKLLTPSRPAALLAIFLFGLGMAWAIDLLGVLLRLKAGQLVPPSLAGLQVGEAGSWLLAAALALIGHPIAEGLVFAGLLYPALAKATQNNLASIVLTALIFMGCSLFVSNAPSQWYALIQPALMWLVVAAVRAYTQSTRAAIVARMAFGVFFVLAAVFGAGF